MRAYFVGGPWDKKCENVPGSTRELRVPIMPELKVFSPVPADIKTEDLTLEVFTYPRYILEVEGSWPFIIFHESKVPVVILEELLDSYCNCKRR